MTTPIAWTRGYARQALADLDTWDHLRDATLPESQKLHFLQMACEKLTKAHLCQSGSRPRDVQASHAYTARGLPVVVQRQMQMENVGRQALRGLMPFVKRLAGEIELLAPAVDDGGRRPDNCEYPWEDAQDKLWIPAEYRFAVSRLLLQPQGRTISRLIRAALLRLIA